MAVMWVREGERPSAVRPRKLTPAQECQVLRWINGKYPMQYGHHWQRMPKTWRHSKIG